MRIVEGPYGDDSRTAFLLAPDLPRRSVSPTRLHAGAWCSLVLSVGWAAAIILSGVAGVVSIAAIETDSGGYLVPLLVPIYGMVFSVRLVRSADDIAAFIALWPLHILALPFNMVGALEEPFYLPSLLLNLATIGGFWWEKRWWDRF